MDYTQYIKPELLILVPVLYLIGAGLKESAFMDKYIPMALGTISIILCAIWVLSTTESNQYEFSTAIFIAITQGVLIAGASVYTNQIIKQAQKEE